MGSTGLTFLGNAFLTAFTSVLLVADSSAATNSGPCMLVVSMYGVASLLLIRISFSGKIDVQGFRDPGDPADTTTIKKAPRSPSPSTPPPNPSSPSSSVTGLEPTQRE